MTRKVKEAKDLKSNELIYFKGHAKATYMSDGRSVEDAINQIGAGGGTVDLSGYATKVELNGKQDKIDDLETIRSGASKGATALQGDGVVQRIEKVSALPTNPDANTLYIIV